MNRTNSKHIKALYLLSAFAIALSLGRSIYSANLSFLFLIWNLFLAWVPYWISIYGFKNAEKINLKTLSIIACWLAFLPNAPYLVTDFIHFNNHGKLKWLDIVLLSSYATAGILLFYTNLIAIRSVHLNKMSTKLKHVCTLLIIAASAYGIYLGRVLRFNSWDVLTDPIGLGNSIIQSLFNPNYVKHTLYITSLFMVFLYISIIVFDYLLSPANEEKD